VIGRDAKREEVTTYDLASRMVDLDVDLSPELTKASCTSAYFQASHVITTRDALEEFVAADIGHASLDGAHGRSSLKCYLG
jgi:aminoglycoside/choline kinase family phosphotransferase